MSNQRDLWRRTVQETARKRQHPFSLSAPSDDCHDFSSYRRPRRRKLFSSSQATTTTTATLMILLVAAALCIQTSQCFQQNNEPSVHCRRKGALQIFERINGHAAESDSFSSVPQHVAFVCDGNSRWARSRGLPVIAGHAAGADRLVDVVLPSLKRSGVQYCTMYGFSTENWKRTPNEIRDIFAVMEHTADKVCQRLLNEREPVRVKILGDLADDRIPESLRAALLKLQRETDRLCDDQTAAVGGECHTLCLAVNYGGRQDILEAAKRVAQAAAAAGEESDRIIDQLSEADFSALLSTHGIPDPDLIIRTSGERRLSNFLLWNAAYAELYFTDALWPDFDDKAMTQALDWYSQRKRRFGTRQQLA